jgi:C4-dicarboxylate transporter, DctQ subunit
MQKLDAVLDFVEKGVIYICFSICLVSLCVGIITRYVLMRPLAWPDELSTYLFILMSFLGASASVRSNSELKVDALYERFPQWRVGLDLFLNGVRLIAAVLIVFTGFQFVSVEMEFMNITPVLHIPVPLIFAMLPLFGLFLILRTLIRLQEMFRGR